LSMVAQPAADRMTRIIAHSPDDFRARVAARRIVLSILLSTLLA
jgi:hypothetical protein